MKNEYRYGKLTWQEIDRAVKEKNVVVLPTAATEDHGHHLPLDVDALLTESVCLEAGRRASDRMLVLPAVKYGLDRHHIDFPGTIHIEPEVFIAFCLNITKSVAYHGFEKILIVNGHGSNTPLVDLVARKTVLETHSLCAAVNYWDVALPQLHGVLETEAVGHSDEFETSLYLHICPDHVRMDAAKRGDDVQGRFMSSDSMHHNPVRFNDYWGRWTQLGVHGDPTVATREKGRKIFEAAVAGLVEVVDELRGWPIGERTDMHTAAHQTDIQW